MVMKILVIEDSETRKEFFREVLVGNMLSFSTSSDAAISLLKAEKFDLIFLDMDLDDGLGQGLMVARWLKETGNAYADVIVHSMNISVASEVKIILPETQIVPFAELKRIAARFGNEEFIERVLG